MNSFFGGNSKEKKQQKKEEAQKAAAAPSGAAGLLQAAPTQEFDLGEMKRGDYMIHVYLQKGKNFKTGSGSDKSGEKKAINALVQVSLGQQSSYSKCLQNLPLNKNDADYWGEHFFFEPKKLSSEEIQSQQITLKVLDKGVFRDQMLGQFEMDLSQIYFMNDSHVIQHQWVALCNPDSDDPNSIKGYLKVSVAVQGPGDSSVCLSDPTGAEDPDQPVMMSASIKKKYKQIRMSLIQAQKLPKLDMLGTIDAYVTGEYAGQSLKSKTVTQKSEKCDFMQVFKFSVEWPLTKDKLTLKILDEDNVTDESVGSITFSVKDIVKNYSKPGGAFLWKNIYGAPLSNFEDPFFKSVAQKMNDNPAMATLWKGRLLFHIEALDSKAPEQGIAELDPEVAKLCRPDQEIFQQRTFELQAEIGAAICLPEQRKYKIRIQVADLFLDTDQPLPEQNFASYNRWSKRHDSIKFKCPYRTVEELGRIYFYLMDGSNPICYWQGWAKDFVEDRNPAYTWYPLKFDQSLGTKNKEPQNAGLLQMKMSIVDCQRNPQISWQIYPSWKEKPPKRLIPKKVRCYIFQCRDLATSDADGAADPYISIRNFKNEQIITNTVDNSLNPIFFEARDFDTQYWKLESAPPIVLDVYDADSGILDSSDDFLGRAVINLTDDSVVDLGSTDPNLNTPPQPKWHPLKTSFQKDAPAKGYVLASFARVDCDTQFETRNPEHVQLSKHISVRDYTIDIHALGMRQLQSFGLIPIRKAFIKFNTKSLLPPDRALAVSNISTEPRDTGPSPNINTAISFTTELPTNSLYCPSLSCEVFDYICKGASQPKVGTFTIDIGQIMQDQLNLRSSQSSMAQRIKLQLEQSYDHTVTFVGASEEFMRQKNRDSYARSLGIELGGQGGQGPAGIITKRKKSKRTGAPGPPSATREEQMGLIGNDLLSQPSERRFDQPSQLEEGTTSYLRDQTIDQDDYDDETVLQNVIDEEAGEGSSLMDDDRQIDSRRILPQGAIDRTNVMDSMPNISKLVKSSQPADAAIGQAEEEEQKLADLFHQSTKGDKEALKQYNDMVASLRQRRERREAREGLGQIKEDNKMLKAVEARLAADIQELTNAIKLEGKRKMNVDQITDTMRMIRQGKDVTKNIHMADYTWDERLKVNRETPESVPPKSLYKAIGYDKPAGQGAAPTPLQRHYRKFYRDELENNKAIFHKLPFQNVKIIRGEDRQPASLGNLGGLLDYSLFGGDDEEENVVGMKEKNVGMFKGHIKIYNPEEDEQYNQIRMEQIEEIEQLISSIHVKKFGKTLDIDLGDLTTGEDKNKLRHLLITMEVGNYDELLKFLLQASYEAMLTKQLATPQDCLVRLYLLEGFDFASRDLGSSSDPYIIIRCGKQVVNRRDQYQLDEANPRFYECFEFTGKFPGASPLEIEAYDYDDMFGDDLIGKTVIDLDDRLYCPEWRTIEDKPVEYRELYHPSTSLAQGTVLCWVDIDEPKNAKNHSGGKASKMWDISPEPIQEYQLRLSVMEAKNIPTEDIEGTSDVFVKAWMDPANTRETDTHWRSQGNASFNYRLLFDFKSPTYSKSESEAYKLKLQVFDRDVFKSNDYICEFVLDLSLIVLDCRATQRCIHLNKKYYETYFREEYTKQRKAQGEAELWLEFEDQDSFWLLVKREKDAKPIKIKLDLRIVPASEAKGQKVGEARTEPNHSPELAKPAGRLQLSANPYAMLTQMVGPEVLDTCAKYMALIICLSLCVAITPVVMGDIVSKMILSFFGIA